MTDRDAALRALDALWRMARACNDADEVNPHVSTITKALAALTSAEAEPVKKL